MKTFGEKLKSVIFESKIGHLPHFGQNKIF